MKDGEPRGSPSFVDYLLDETILTIGLVVIILVVRDGRNFAK